MQIFQSWSDIIIMFILAIAYIVTFIAQKNQIRILKETIKSHSELTASQGVHIETFKKMFNPADIEALMNLKVEQAVINTKDEIDKMKDKNKMEISRDVLTRHYIDLTINIYVLMKFKLSFSEKERYEYIERNMTFVKPIIIDFFNLYDKRLPAIEKTLYEQMKPSSAHTQDQIK